MCCASRSRGAQPAGARHSGWLFTQRVIICSVRAGCVYAAM